MKLTTKGKYAVALLLDVSANAKDGPVRLADVAGRTTISVHYLEQLARKLRRAGLITSVRGPGGGYIPGAATADTTLKAVFDAVGEKQGFDGVPGLGLVVETYLTTTTLSSLALDRNAA